MQKSERSWYHVLSFILTVINGLWVIGLALVILFIRPVLNEVYMGLRGSLSSGARFILYFPDFAVMLLALTFLTLLVVKEFVFRKRVCLGLNLAWMAVALLITILVVLAMIAPGLKAFQSM